MHVMIDLETVSRAPEAAIIQVAAVEFELVRGGNVRVDRAFKTGVALAGQRRHIEEDTVCWWAQQDQRHIFFESLEGELSPDMMTLDQALEALRRWFTETIDQPYQGVWSHGASFDLAILRSAYSDNGDETPWPYRLDRDTRTFHMARGDDWGRDHPYKEKARLRACEIYGAGDRHDALYDAVLHACELQGVA